MIDMTGKILLAVIALGLWTNIGLQLFHPIPAIAQGMELSGIASDVSNIERIARGNCRNPKIC
jgi:hypothetical protein